MASRLRIAPRVDDPKYWLARAEAASRAAEQMVDPQARRTLINISRSYEELARRTQLRVVSARPRKGKPAPAT